MNISSSDGKQRIFAIALLAVLSLVGGCGGSGSSNPDPAKQIGPEEALSRTGAHHQGIGHEARRDYRKAMHDDCVKDSSHLDCSVSGRGWFSSWNRLPEVHVSSSSTQEEVWAAHYPQIVSQQRGRNSAIFTDFGQNPEQKHPKTKLNGTAYRPHSVIMRDTSLPMPRALARSITCALPYR